MKRAPTMTVVRARLGEVVIRSDCNCGLCRAYRAQPNAVIRTLEENRSRGGGLRNTIEQSADTYLNKGLNS